MFAAVGVLLAWAWRSIPARVAAALGGVAIVALFAFFFPILAALPLTPDDWRNRIWLADCDRPGAPTLELPDGEISSGPPPDGWCWI
jgi:dolichyl-phosphate-mannose--protein O-mannosyl transferase